MKRRSRPTPQPRGARPGSDSAQSGSSRSGPSQAGSSLIELLIGIGVAVLLVSSALTGVASHQAQRRMHGEKILAMAACRNTLETLRSVEIDQLPSYDGTGFDIPGQNGEANGLTVVPGDSDGLAGEITVARHPSWDTDNELYIVRTTVQWLGVHRTGRLAMETLMSERR